MRVLGVLAVLAGGVLADGLEARLPADTLFAATFEDLPATEKRWRASDWNALWQDPRMKPLIRELDRFEAGAKRDWERQGKAWPGEFRRAVGGEVVVAMLPEGAVLLFERRAGADFAAITSSIKRGRMHMHLTDDVVVLAWKEAALQRVVRGPERRTLLDVAAYRELARQAGRDADVRVYLPRPILEDLGGWYRNLGDLLKIPGADRVQAVGLSLRFRERALETRAFLLAPGGKRGLLRIFSGRNSTLEPPPWIPARARHVATLRFDLGELGRLLGETAPGQLEQLMQMTGGKAALAVYRSLGDHFTTVSFGGRTPSVLVASVDDPRRLKRVLGALKRPRVAGGASIYATSGGAAAVDGNWMMTSNSPALINALARWRGVRLGELDAYRTALAHLPAERVMVWYGAEPYDRKNPWSAWIRAQAGAVVNDRNGLAIHHIVLLR